MKRGKRYGTSVITGLTGLLFLGLLVIGCETDSATSPLTITPAHVQLRRGQSQEFVAAGGYEYNWSIEKKGMGILARTPENNRVVYTAVTAPEEGTAIQVLRVVSWIEGASGGTTVTNANGDSSRKPYRVQQEAYIIHLPEDPAPVDVDETPVTNQVSASTVKVRHAVRITLREDESATVPRLKRMTGKTASTIHMTKTFQSIKNHEILQNSLVHRFLDCVIFHKSY